MPLGPTLIVDCFGFCRRPMLIRLLLPNLVIVWI